MFSPVWSASLASTSPSGPSNFGCGKLGSTSDWTKHPKSNDSLEGTRWGNIIYMIEISPELLKASSTMDLSIFRTLFQDLPECRKLIIRCLAGGNLMALRKAIGFWLSENEKKSHLSLLWDVFEDMNWIDDVDGVTMIGRGLDFHRAEGQLRDSSLTHCSELVPFVIMIRAPVPYDKLVPWIKQILSNMTRSTKMRVVEGSKRKNRWDSKFIATIEGFVAGVKIFAPVTVLTRETRQDRFSSNNREWAALKIQNGLKEW